MLKMMTWTVMRMVDGAGDCCLYRDERRRVEPRGYIEENALHTHSLLQQATKDRILVKVKVKV
jgi:hypothetical protein